MTREQRLARMRELLEPMQKYSSVPETAAPVPEAEASNPDDR